MAKGGSGKGGSKKTERASGSQTNLLPFQIGPAQELVQQANDLLAAGVPSQALDILSQAASGIQGSLPSPGEQLDYLRATEQLLAGEPNRAGNALNPALDVYESLLDRGNGANVNPAISLYQSELSRNPLSGFLSADPNQAIALLRPLYEPSTSTEPLINAITADVQRSYGPQVAARFGLAGRTGADTAQQLAAREISRTLASTVPAIRQAELERRAGVAGQIGQFSADDANRALQANLADINRRLSAIGGVGTVSSDDANRRLNAAQGYAQTLAAQEGLRQVSIGQLAAARQAIAGQENQALGQAADISSVFTSLPYLPLQLSTPAITANLGGTFNQTGKTSSKQQASPLGILGNVAGLGLTAAGLGLFGPLGGAAGASAGALGPLSVISPTAAAQPFLSGGSTLGTFGAGGLSGLSAPPPPIWLRP